MFLFLILFPLHWNKKNRNEKHETETLWNKPREDEDLNFVYFLFIFGWRDLHYVSILSSVNICQILVVLVPSMH